MCYSSRIWADYRRYVKEFGATLDIKEFVRVFWERRNEPRVKIPKAMEAAFVDSQDAAGAEIRSLIEEFSREQAAELASLRESAANESLIDCGSIASASPPGRRRESPGLAQHPATSAAIRTDSALQRTPATDAPGDGAEAPESTRQASRHGRQARRRCAAKRGFPLHHHAEDVHRAAPGQLL